MSRAAPARVVLSVDGARDGVQRARSVRVGSAAVRTPRVQLRKEVTLGGQEGHQRKRLGERGAHLIARLVSARNLAQRHDGARSIVNASH